MKVFQSLFNYKIVESIAINAQYNSIRLSVKGYYTPGSNQVISLRENVGNDNSCVLIFTRVWLIFISSL
uniref:Uncharacterized protein n=1 Tax=Romanomermis culicivorax TaxID=13658 RepID=A0A915IW25_ROMCU